jgi:SAM-dependent methyltransferase
LLDAACGPGHQLAAMAAAGYRMTGLDVSHNMLAIAGEHLAAEGAEATLIESTFEAIGPDAGPFDGIYCVGNSLAATGSEESARASFAAMASLLAPRGRLFIQILNFQKLRGERPALRGPRVCRIDGIDYVSSRLFFFNGDAVEVTSLTIWNEGGWQQYAGSGSLYAISPEQLDRWARASGLSIDERCGSYHREPFDTSCSGDLIVLATKRA